MASLEQQVASLRRELESLKLQLRGSPGVSTSGGAISIRTMQLGFRGVTTSTFDANNGYSWKRSRLDLPSFVDPGVQLTGDKAFSCWNDSSLPVGTAGWFEPSPDAQGYIFTISTPQSILRAVLRGVTAGSVSSGGTGTVTLTGGGSQSAYNPYTATIGSGVTCHIAYVANTAQYEFIAVNC